ncbi:MAG TPA: SDR family oxidoreductase, partial [Bacteroidetes bacterium]|nr:SDR family oxidoreductase [Bacteroidota bacterium]
LITGASTGIGYASVKAFLAKGYQVYGSVRKEADASRLQTEFGQHFTPLLFDVTDPAAIAKAAEKVEAEIGKEGLAGLINNAGMATVGPLMLQELDNLRLQFEVNVIGLMAVTQAFLPLLGAKKNPGFPPGRILMLSSVGGKISAPFVGAYSGSKHAVEGIANSLRRELMLYGVDVVIIGPGAIKTPIWEKPSATDISHLEGTDYEPSMKRFLKIFVKAGKMGLEADDLAQRMLKVFEKKKPKARYTFAPNKFKDFTLVRLIPSRMLDRIIAKQMELKP